MKLVRSPSWSTPGASAPARYRAKARVARAIPPRRHMRGVDVVRGIGLVVLKLQPTGFEQLRARRAKTTSMTGS